MDVNIYINGSERTDLSVRRMTRSYLEPWSADLCYEGCHDAAGMPAQWDRVVIERVSDGTTTTSSSGGGNALFRGEIVERAPGGVSEEGIVFTARGRRFRLENEPVRINGRSHYVWNRRGHQCHNESGEDSPGRDGGKWTVGEIAVDILEHALGLPNGGSDIAGHHSHECSVTDTYLTADDIASYDASDWLALDTVTGEFSVEDMPVAFALDMLVGLAGGFYGWYVDAEGTLHLTDLTECPTKDIQAGEFGHWQDEAGTDYRLLDNRLEWSLDGVATQVVVQGTDRTVEEKPANIEGTGNTGRGELGELELVNAPWRSFDAAYRHVCQSRRLPTMRDIDPESELTPPEGWTSFDHRPRIYRGTASGPKYVYEPDSGVFPTWNRVTGIIGFHEEPQLDPGNPPAVEAEKLWGWYYARVPFTASAGPDGDAYWWYGYERTVTVYDQAFKHPTSWPQPGMPDDAEAMEVLAERLLEQRKDVRRQGVLVCDEVASERFGLDTRFNVLNLGPTATTPATTTSTMPPHPARWDTLQINAVAVTYDFESNSTELTVANTFFMLEGYSEVKRRLEENLFLQRNLDLSEDLNDCQVQISAWRNHGDKTTTTTPAPTSTTTDGASTTTTTPPPTTTTAVPECQCEDCADLAAQHGGMTHAGVEMASQKCTDFGYGCAEAAVSYYILQYNAAIHGWVGVMENHPEWEMRVECVPCTSDKTTTTTPATTTTSQGDFRGNCYQATIYYQGTAVYRTNPVCLACCENGGLLGEATAYGLYNETDLNCEGCSIDIVFTCITEPSTTTTTAGATTTTTPSGESTTTTTAAPTTTTTLANQCPSDCSDKPATVYASIGADCYAGCSGTYSWTLGSCPSWQAGDGPCEFGMLSCNGGQWTVHVPSTGSSECIYSAQLGTGGPTGTYSLERDNGCGDCDTEITIYS